jgi:hypothetical protein
VKASVEAGKPYIPALKRPEVKSAGIAAFLSLSVEAKKKAAARAVAKFGRPSSAGPRYFICYARVASSRRAIAALLNSRLGIDRAYRPDEGLNSGRSRRTSRSTFDPPL